MTISKDRWNISPVANGKKIEETGPFDECVGLDAFYPNRRICQNVCKEEPGLSRWLLYVNLCLRSLFERFNNSGFMYLSGEFEFGGGVGLARVGAGDAIWREDNTIDG